MIPTLYESDEYAFQTAGLGKLTDCVSCKVTEERNGIYECDFQYPATGHNAELIKCGRIIAVTHDKLGDIQPFDIVAHSKPIDGLITFHAVHVSYRLSKCIAAGNQIRNLYAAFHAIEESLTPIASRVFSFTTDMKSVSGYVGAFDGTPKTVKSLLGGVDGSILDTFGGEYEWKKFTVKLWKSRGVDRPLTIRYGVNLVDYTDEVDYSESFTSCVGYWVGSTSGGQDASLFSFIESGATSYNGREEIALVDFSDKFETLPTLEELNAAASSYMASNQVYLPSQTISIKFADLRDSSEYDQLNRLFDCNLCDTVRVVFPQYDMDGRFKIVKTVYDVLLERYDDIELGTLPITLRKALGIGK